MPKNSFTLIKGDKISNADYRDALPVNMYAVKRDVRDSAGYMINYPGIKPFAETEGVDRGGFYSERFGEHFRISGNNFNSISSTGRVTNLGTISGSLQVKMDQSFNNFAMVEDGKLWYYNPTDGFRRITDSNLGLPIDLCFVDGYFFFTDGENLYHTKLADEEALEPLDFATAEFSPDPTLSVKKTKENQVIVFGRYSTEWFVNVGSENFAFQRIQGKAIKAGIVSTQCQAEMDGTFFILGGRKEESPSIHAVGGGSITTVATREVDKIIDLYDEEELQTSSLEARVEDGYQFLHVNLPDYTLVYNHTIAKSLGIDHAWSILKTSITRQDGWIGINGIFDPRIGNWLYGDRFNPRVGELDNTISTLYGNDTEFILYSPMITLDGRSIDEVEIKTISGFTPYKASVSVSLSYDGQAYSKEWFNMYGDKNERAKRFIIRRLGNVNDYVSFKFRAVTPSRLAFGAMELTYG